MHDYRLTKHAKEMMAERGILEEWIKEVIEKPKWENMDFEGNLHYLKPISGYGDRILHLVINPKKTPKNIITIFFDRRARRKI